MKTIFIAGTDTEVGKTTFTVAWMQALLKARQRVVGIKPVSAGCVQQAGIWQNEDALQLQAASNVPLAYQQINPVALPDPISPHIAADRVGQSVTTESLSRHMATLAGVGADVVLVEGAGGWYCPINACETLADLVVQQRWPVIMVVGMRLGCLNHALLTAKALQADGVELIGWVANTLGEPMAAYDENLQTLQQGLPAPLIAEMHQGPVIRWLHCANASAQFAAHCSGNQHPGFVS